MSDFLTAFYGQPAKAEGTGIGAKFSRFLSNIELSPTQKENASARHRALRAKLDIEFPGSRSFIVGSYGKNTSIRPPSDLDIMLVLPTHIYDRYSTIGYLLGSRNAQSEFLQEIKRRIQKVYPNTDMSADGQVIVLKFANSFSVEIIPCFEISGFYSKKYRIADTNHGGRWREEDPDGESAAITASNKLTNGNTVRLIKMLKCWKRTCNVPLKSFHLEILAQDFLRSYEHKDKSTLYFDYMTRDFFKWLYGRVDNFFGVYITRPGTGESINIGTTWQSKAESARDRALKAIDYENREMPYSANGEWQKIYGTDFSG
ncbi:MAG: hypothetical protein HOP07_05545 [Bacteriovoracaceae bacterium]|nr:hypothetical protein [Bacteriovoracaceae bacterium]